MDMLGRIKNKVLSMKKRLYFRTEELYYCLDLEKKYHIFESGAVECCFGTQEDIEKMVEGHSEIFGEKKKKRFKHRLESGQRLFLVKLDGEIAAYNWHNIKEAALTVGINIPLKEEQIFLFDVHTFPEFRGRGLFKKIMAVSIMLMKKEGYREVHLTHMSDNFISEKVFRKIGFKNTKKYSLLRIFGKNFIKKEIFE